MFMGTDFRFSKMNAFWGRLVVVLAREHDCLIHRSVHSKTATVVNFMLCVSYHNERKCCAGRVGPRGAVNAKHEILRRGRWQIPSPAAPSSLSLNESCSLGTTGLPFCSGKSTLPGGERAGLSSAAGRVALQCRSRGSAAGGMLGPGTVPVVRAEHSALVAGCWQPSRGAHVRVILRFPGRGDSMDP